MLAAQVSMPLPHATFAHTVPEQLLMLGEEALAEALDAVILFLAQRLPDERSGFLEVVGQRLPDALWSAINRSLIGGCSGVKGDEPPGQRMDTLFGDPPLGQQSVERVEVQKIRRLRHVKDARMLRQGELVHGESVKVIASFDG